MAARSSRRCISTMCSEPALVSSIPAHIDLPRPSFVPHQPHCSTPLCLFTLTPPLTSPPLGHYSPFASLSSSSCSSSFASSSTSSSSSSSSSSFSNCRSENSNFLTIPTSADPLGPPRCSTYSRTTPRHRRQRSRPSIPISFFSAAIPTPPIPALTSPFDTKPLGLNRGSILNLNLTTHSSINAGVTTAAETLDFLCTTFTTAQLCSAAAAQQTGMLLSSNHGTHHHHHHHHASMPFDHQQMHGGFDASSSSSSSSSTGHYAVNATGNGSSSSSSAGNRRTNNRPHGHGHSVSSDSGRPRSVSSRQDSGPSQRTPSQVGVSHDSGLTDEQRLSTLRQQQAQRRPKMVRLTPAVKHLNQSTRSMSASMSPSLGGAVTSASSSINANGESSRPASVVGIASLTGYSSSASSSSASSSAVAAVEADPQVGLTIFIDPKSNGSLANAKVIFPMVGSPPNAPPPPLHPGSRRALAQRAGLQPADGASLQLDLGCISGPSVVSDTSASANSASTLPDLVRKKSGEPVKSSLKHFAQSAFLHRADSSPAAPASFHRAKSVPTTPTSSKAVHFDPVLEHVKVFKHRQRPTAVSRDGSPEHTETETEEEREFPFYQNWRRQVALNAGLGSPGGGSAGSASPGGGSALSTPTGVAGEGATEQLVLRLPNFPSSAKLSVDRDVFLERVFLSDDLRSVKGTVQVRNLAFEKWLAVRFSLDGWATACEVSAEHSESIKGGKSDRFTFSIKLNELLIWGNRGAGSSSGEQETKTMLLCLRYNTAGQEFWDNNEGLNYQLDFRLRPVVLPSPGGSGSGSGSGGATSGATRQHRERAESASSASGSGMARAATVTPARTKGHSPGMSPSELGSSSSSSRRPHHRNQHNLEAEELGRSLERLRAEDHRGIEDDDDDRMPLALRVVVKNRRRSPPVSPGLVTSSSPTTSSSNGGSGGRSSSPSMWAARYDLSESLKNPKTGSRITSAGRQAALDYFSAKPPAPPSSSSSSTGGQQPRAIFIGTSAGGGAGNGDVFSPSEAGESPTPGASRGSDGNNSSGSGGNVGGTSLAVPMGMFTTKAGMISPGLGEVIAHLPMSMTMSNGSGTASPSTGGNSPVSETNGGTPDASSNSTTMVMESSPPGSNMTSSSSSSSLNNNNSSHMTSMTTMRSSEANGSRSSMHTTKFYSYPVNRNTLSPAGQLYRLTRGSDERASSPLARTLAQQQQQTSMYSNHSTSSISSISPSPSPSQQSSGRESPVKKDRGSLLGGGVILSSSFLNDSPQNSPISPLNSPNPFSPTLSISSLESEMTTCLASPEDAVVVVSSGGNGNGSSSRLSTVEIRVPPPVSDSIEDIHRSLLNMARGGESSSVLPISVVATMGVGNPSGGSESNHSSATAGSGSPTLSAVSDSSSSTSSSIKPGSVSSYDELIARFCWNGNDNGTTTSSGTPPVVVVGAGPGAVVVVEETTGSDVNGLGGEISSAGGMHIQHVPHRMFASSMGSPTTESGSTTPTIGF